MKLRAVVLISLLFSSVFAAAVEKEICVGAVVGEKISFISSDYRQGSEVGDRAFKLFGGIDIGEYFGIDPDYLHFLDEHDDTFSLGVRYIF